jgi:hypothetical protein
MRHRRDPSSRDSVGGQLRTVLIASAIAMVLAGGAAVMAAASATDFAPKVGDILVFRTNSHPPADWEFTAVGASDDLPVNCKLRPVVMARAGGSLVVEQRSKDARLYHVHWAGSRTSEASTDCGPAADLLLSVEDLQLLSNAVGGPGVEHSVFGVF